MDAKRRLPLLQSAPRESEADPVRSRLAWVVFGALATFVVWLPLSAIWLTVAGRAVRSSGDHPASALVLGLAAGALFSLAVAAFAGGALLGRWGGARVGAREAMLSGGLAGVLAVTGAWGAVGVTPGALVVLPVAILAAWLGARVGRDKAR